MAKKSHEGFGSGWQNKSLRGLNGFAAQGIES
jgi:hypothetical protein